MSEYKGLNRLLHFVRGAQNYAAVVAEGLILLAFAGSSLDVSIGGKLAGIGWLAVGWGIVFALGIDTSFILSWVRVRQIAMGTGKKRHLWWAIPLAVGMSFIVFQPVAIQQLQQSMGLSFNQALTNLGIDLNLLVYARSGVAVLLGAVLAMTNVETPKVQGGATKVQVTAQDGPPLVQLPAQAGSLHEHLTALLEQGVPINKSLVARTWGTSRSQVQRMVNRLNTQRSTVVQEEVEVPKVTWGEDGRVDTVQFPGKQAVKAHQNKKEADNAM